MDYALSPDRDLSVQIAQSLRAAILDGTLDADERLPSEQELAERFEVSRPTVREALKRLAAQNLIRTRRGATGGAFVNRLTYAQAAEQQVTLSSLLLSMNEVDFTTACQARYALERAAVPMATTHRTADQLAEMTAELARQGAEGLSDEAFCASDVAFHTALVEGSANPVLSWHVAGAVAAMQPLMNMLTFTARDRAQILSHHRAILEALRNRQPELIDSELTALSNYTISLFETVQAQRAQQEKTNPA